jgi:hypothetical protein
MIQKRVSARRIPPAPPRKLTFEVSAAEYAELERAAARAGLSPQEWAAKMVANTATLFNSIENLFPRKANTP